MHIDDIVTAHSLRSDLNKANQIEDRLRDDIYRMQVGTIEITGLLRELMAKKMQEAVVEYRGNIWATLGNMGISLS